MSLLPNAIIYKYNKHIQVNGTLFYAFDYLCQLIENEIEQGLESKLPETRFYIIIPRKYQKDYLDKLLMLFKTKYPIWNHKLFSDKVLLDNARNTLSKDKYIELKNTIQVVAKAFNRIKLITNLELLKKDFNNVLLPCMNTWLEIKDYVKAKHINVIQNRQFSSLKEIGSISNIDLIESNLLFLYELNEQYIGLDNCKQYTPKIGFKFMIPKELFKLYPKTEKIIAGKPIANIGIIDFNENTKPSLFVQVQNKFFLNTKQIEYHRNFLRWDENNRILPEARYYNIKINIINAFTKGPTLVPDINNTPIYKNLYSLDNLPEDSSVSRMEQPLSNYTLLKDDPLILFLGEKSNI